MGEKFYIVKILKDDSFKNFIEDLDKGIETEYRIASKGYKLYSEMQENVEVVFILFEKNNDGTIQSTKIFITEAIKSNNHRKLICKAIAKTEYSLNIYDFQEKISLELNKDIDNAFIIEELSYELYNDFKKELLSKRRRIKPNEIEKKNIDMNDFAQQEAECIKSISDNGKRSSYERDKDRIVHSKAFRRLVDKAQIFTSQKGDHYRTRMTHTLEVSQIARSIARRLHLNEDLVETIALAHDIGHTPFGHQGERTLNRILNGNFGIIRNIENKNPKLRQGFKHNFQGLRVLTLLEQKYTEIEGLNMSYQVLEGVWKHTKIKKDGELLYPLEDFFSYEGCDELYSEYEFSTTLEGQVVAISDEIAQRSHDIDDAFKAHKLNAEELLKYSKVKKFKDLQTIVNAINEDIDRAEDNYVIFIDKHDMFRARLCSSLIDYFVTDVIHTSEENIDDFRKSIESNDFYKHNHRFNKKLITWSESASMVSSSLEKMISKKVINSAEVTQFDASSENIIVKLFEYYYNNPLALADSTLRRLYKEYMNLDFGFIDFRNGDIGLVRNEFNKISNVDLENKNESYTEDFKKEYYSKRKLFVKCIADHIGGMTDSFAVDDYHKLYNL